MKENSGFSLVEMIIVVAIMAIAIGVIAPQLIRYIEKSNVSSDIQLADTIRTAVALAIVDAEVVADPDSQPWIQIMNTPAGLNMTGNAAFIGDSCVLIESLETSFGFPLPDILTQMVSSRGSSCSCIAKVDSGVVSITFTETDITGRRDRSNGTPENDIYVD